MLVGSESEEQCVQLPSLLAFKHIGVLECIPKGKVTMAVNFTSREIIAICGLNVTRGLCF